MNIFNTRPSEYGEVTDILHRNEHTRIERIVSLGQTSPEGFWYDQSESEWLTLLQGNAVLKFENKTVELQSGDCLLIPAHEKHRVEYTSKEPPCLWLCVFSE